MLLSGHTHSQSHIPDDSALEIYHDQLAFIFQKFFLLFEQLVDVIMYLERDCRCKDICLNSSPSPSKSSPFECNTLSPAPGPSQTKFPACSLNSLLFSESKTSALCCCVLHLDTLGPSPRPLLFLTAWTLRYLLMAPILLGSHSYQQSLSQALPAPSSHGSLTASLLLIPQIPLLCLSRLCGSPELYFLTTLLCPDGALPDYSLRHHPQNTFKSITQSCRA